MTGASELDAYRQLLRPRVDRVEVVDVPPLPALQVDGAGGPDTDVFAQAIEALYATSYALKFTLKRAGTLDYKVMPLEGLWWSQDMSVFTAGNKDAWQWTLLICQPPAIDDALVHDAVEKVHQSKGLPALERLRFAVFDEGLSAQIMHAGPFSEEGPTIRRLHDAIAEQGLQLRGKHHEIYLNDLRRTAPERLRTVLRQPVAPT